MTDRPNIPLHAYAARGSATLMATSRAFVPTETDKHRASQILLKREAAKLTQGDLAKRIGISTRTLMRYEKCQRAIPSHVVDNIERILGKLNGHEPQPPPSGGPRWTPPALRAAMQKHADELSYAKAEKLRELASQPGVALTDDGWEQVVQMVAAEK